MDETSPKRKKVETDHQGTINPELQVEKHFLKPSLGFATFIFTMSDLVRVSLSSYVDESYRPFLMATNESHFVVSPARFSVGDI